MIVKVGLDIYKTLMLDKGMDMKGMQMHWMRIALVAAAVAAVGAGEAAVKRGKDMTLEQLTKKADVIVVGKCKSKQARWVGGHIETDYEIRVDEPLKGEKLFRAGSSIRMTVMGGSTTTPPISQYTELQPHMYAGEDVALFLKTDPAGSPETRAKAVKMGSNLLQSPRVLGLNQGKFSIVVDEKDGRRKLTKFNLENYGIMPNDSALKRVLRAVASHELNVKSGPVVELGGGLTTTPEGKSALDAAASLDPKGAAALADSLAGKSGDEASGAVINSLRGSPIPIQDLEEFKTQVKQFSN